MLKHSQLAMTARAGAVRGDEEAVANRYGVAQRDGREASWSWKFGLGGWGITSTRNLEEEGGWINLCSRMEKEKAEGI